MDIDISALTDPTWTLSQEIKFNEQCDDPVRELCAMNYPTTRMIRIEQLLENDSQFIDHAVYQEIRQVVLDLKQLIVTKDPAQVVGKLKVKLEKYLRKRFKLKTSEALDLIVEHYIHARIGVLCFMGLYSYESAFKVQYRMKPANVSARSLLDLQDLALPKLEQSIDLLSNMPVLMPTSALREWNNVLAAIKHEAYLKSDCHLLLCIVFALTQSHNFNVIHLLCSISKTIPPSKVDSLSYFDAAKMFIAQHNCQRNNTPMRSIC